jgi:hypothetical protein
MRLATKITLVTAQNTRKFDFLFGSKKFSRPTFVTPIAYYHLLFVITSLLVTPYNLIYLNII